MHFIKKLFLLLTIVVPLAIKSSEDKRNYTPEKIIAMLKAVHSIPASDRSVFENTLCQIGKVIDERRGWLYTAHKLHLDLTCLPSECQFIPTDIMRALIDLFKSYADANGVVNLAGDSKLHYAHLAAVLKENKSSQCDSCKLVEQFFIEQNQLINQRTEKARKILANAR